MVISKEDSKTLAKLFYRDINPSKGDKISIVYSRRLRTPLVTIEKEKSIEYISYFLEAYTREEVGEIVEIEDRLGYRRE